MIVQTIRSLIFYALFFTQTAVLAMIIGLMSKITPGARNLGWALAQYWNSSNVFMLRWIVGIRTEVSGAENIPEGGCIIGSKHQSDWDIFALLPYVGKPAFIAKKELLDIPLFGWAAAWMNTISIDRKRGKNALPIMIEDTKRALENGCRVIIYPEGTRRPAFAEPSYRSGIVKMYQALDVPVVPVALTSGLYWARNSIVLWPGKARAKFLPPIEPGLAPEEFQARLIEAIETETNIMLLEDVREGLARPITPAMRARIAELEATTEGTH
jgi:1-acyl-sn-glycerol-3-phosphate acyltransferase